MTRPKPKAALREIAENGNAVGQFDISGDHAQTTNAPAGDGQSVQPAADRMPLADGKLID